MIGILSAYICSGQPPTVETMVDPGCSSSRKLVNGRMTLVASCGSSPGPGPSPSLPSPSPPSPPTSAGPVGFACETVRKLRDVHGRITLVCTACDPGFTLSGGSCYACGKIKLYDYSTF